MIQRNKEYAQNLNDVIIISREISKQYEFIKEYIKAIPKRFKYSSVTNVMLKTLRTT